MFFVFLLHQSLHYHEEPVIVSTTIWHNQTWIFDPQNRKRATKWLMATSLSAHEMHHLNNNLVLIFISKLHTCCLNHPACLTDISQHKSSAAHNVTDLQPHRFHGWRRRSPLSAELNHRSFIYIQFTTFTYIPVCETERDTYSYTHSVLCMGTHAHTHTHT